jgi:hypothetical protein
MVCRKNALEPPLSCAGLPMMGALLHDFEAERYLAHGY